MPFVMHNEEITPGQSVFNRIIHTSDKYFDSSNEDSDTKIINPPKKIKAINAPSNEEYKGLKRGSRSGVNNFTIPRMPRIKTSTSGIIKWA